MKKFAPLLIAVAFILFQIGNASAEYVWINGKVEEVSDKFIKVANIQYIIYPEMRVIKHVKKNSAIYEKPATLEDVRRFQTVNIRVNGGAVMEIIIEKYH